MQVRTIKTTDLWLKHLIKIVLIIIKNNDGYNNELLAWKMANPLWSDDIVK